MIFAQRMLWSICSYWICPKQKCHSLLALLNLASKVQHQTVNYLFSISFPEKEESVPVRKILPIGEGGIECMNEDMRCCNHNLRNWPSHNHKCLLQSWTNSQWWHSMCTLSNLFKANKQEYSSISRKENKNKNKKA